MATNYRNNFCNWIADRREVIALPFGIAVFAAIALASAMIASWGR